MKNITNSAELKNSVRELEMLQFEKEELIKLHARNLVEQVKPVNILKKAVVHSPLIKGTFSKTGLTGNLIQIGAGFLLKRIFRKKS